MSLVVVDLGSPEPAPSGDGCTTTLAEAIQQTRRILLTSRREIRNRLTDAVTAGAGSITCDFPLGALQTGSRISIDLEDFYVWSVDGVTATLEPGDNGSIPAAHDAGAIVRVNTKFSDFEIQRAINDVLRELSSPGSGLYRVNTVDLVNNGAVVGYDLTDVTGIQDIIEIKYDDPGSMKLWPPIPEGNWRLQRQAVTTDFPSGFALTIFDHPAADDGATIRVTYKGEYSPLADYTDNVETVAGLRCSAHDLLWIGAGIRLTDSREIARNFSDSQGEPRRAGEVPAGAEGNSYSGLLRRWQSRLSSEGSRQSREFPTHLPRIRSWR